MSERGGDDDEGISLGEAPMRKVPDHSPTWGGPGHL